MDTNDRTSIDTLTLDIVVKNDNATKRLDAFLDVLTRLNKEVEKSGNLDKVLEKLNGVSPTTTGGGRASNGGSNTRTKEGTWKKEVYQQDTLGNSYLAQLSTIKKINGEKSTTVEYFDKENNRIKTVTTQIDKYGNSVKKVQKEVQKLNAEVEKKPKSKTWGSVGLFTKLGNISYLINMMRFYGDKIARVVQYGMDYVETLNLWQVANRENIAMADEFISKMREAYGISETTLRNYQAIFKNMISALGDLEDAVASRLSQQLTQMALDFSSLYNVSIQNAMEKFQSVLSGEVIPIRTVSGYDITEPTIIDLYQRMGGEKSMRQLNQLEKRLLRISAVFEQMGKSGAIGEDFGDLASTIESASNQARIMSEQFKEVMTWSGQLILQLLNSAGILQYINAILMTIAEIMRSLAFSNEDVVEEWTRQAVAGFKEANDEMDELQGKLLAFDKFNALNSGAGKSSITSVDPVIAKMIEDINFGMANADMQARKLSNTWLEALGMGEKIHRVINENGEVVEYTAEQWAELDEETKNSFSSMLEYSKMSGALQGVLDIVAKLGTVLIVAFGMSALKRLIMFTTGVKNLGMAFTKLLPVGIIVALWEAIEAFKEGDVWGGILATTVGVVLVGAFALLNKEVLIKTWQALGKGFIALLFNAKVATGSLGLAITSLSVGFIGLGTAIAGAFLLIQNWGYMSAWQKVIGIIGVATTAILGLALAIGAFHSAWSIGLAVGGIVAGIAMMATAIATVKKDINVPAFATGGFPEDGLFFANSGELVGKFSNGRTAVANNDQIVTGITQGVYNAMMAYNAQTRGQAGGGDVYLDGNKVGRVVAKGSHSEMVRIGLVKASS